MVDQPIEEPWLSAAAAAQMLGVQTRSLYAYVSRGLVRSVAAARGRLRLYAREDLERLRLRRDARAGHGAVAAGALQFGDAVLDSSITELGEDGPRYRGYLAVELAERGVPFENVAELLWTGVLCDGPVRWLAPKPGGAGRSRPTDSVIDALMEETLALARTDDARSDGRGDALARCGRTLIPQLALASNPAATRADRARAARCASIAGMVAEVWRLPGKAVLALDAALILLADHELNASTFAARVAASTGADPYAVVMAALAALSGPRHGTAALEVVQLLRDTGGPTQAAAVASELRGRHRLPPGFGHRAYRGVDPRAPPLLALAERLGGTRSAVRAALSLRDVVGRAGSHPNVDLGLAALAAAVGAPGAAVTAWFAVARCAGWLAHAAEQRAAGTLLRPRARYQGPALRPVEYLDEARPARRRPRRRH
ncbi:MAG: citrate/2-methylcitrate synthase [Kofleriaceae bacterium]